ncbi:MAG: signal peptidase II [Flavobacteriaceae bacterium]|nr:signal peptidase II [Flavobacteriaceae bacterium]
MSLNKAIWIILLVLIIDQVLKIYMKTHFQLQEGFDIINTCGDVKAPQCRALFKFYFIENEGMAWGVKIPGQYGKLFLTIFRLFAISGIGYWLWESTKKHAPKVLILSIALIFAGAFGNIIDSVFYGLIFEDSYSQVSSIFPEGGGYGKLFHGKVVDMFSFSFFDPVFNVADFAISLGVGIIIVFNRKAFPKQLKEEETQE